MQPFDPMLLCAEENEVLAALHRRGVEMHYDPGMVVFHERRGDVAGFCRQIFKYGRGRGQVMRAGPVRGTLPHSLSVVLVAYTLAAPGLTVAFGWPALVPLAAYGLAVVAGAAKIGISLRRPAAVPQGAALVVALHGVLRRRGGLGSAPAPPPARAPGRDARRGGGRRHRRPIGASPGRIDLSAAQFRPAQTEPWRPSGSTKCWIST